MADEPKKPGTMTSDDRALVSRRARTSPFGHAITGAAAPIENWEEMKTPIPHDIEGVVSAVQQYRMDLKRRARNESAQLEALRTSTADRVFALSAQLAAVTENVRNLAEFTERFASIEEWQAAMAENNTEIMERFADIVGKDRNNGKLGTLRGRVDDIEKTIKENRDRKWMLIGKLVGAIGAVGMLIWWIVSLRFDIDYMRADVDRLVKVVEKLNPAGPP